MSFLKSLEKIPIILSAGYGKRLNPLTLFKPKPLLEINKKTLLENTIYILEKFGIKEIVINTHYLSDQINAFIDNKKFISKIFLIKEHKKILDTGGGVLNAAKRFNKDPFFVFNPDTIWSQSYLEDFKCMEEQYLKLIPYTWKLLEMRLNDKMFSEINTILNQFISSKTRAKNRFYAN